MAHRLTRRNRSVISGGLHPQYADVCGDARAYGGRLVRAAAAGPEGERGHRRRDRRRDELRHRADRPTSSAIRATLSPIAAAAHARGALLIAVFTDPVALGAVALAGRDGRRHRGRRRPGARQRAEFRRPLRRPVRDANEERAADARASRRRDGGRGRAAQLRADAFHARAAHPPREGDEQHLHQFGLYARSRFRSISTLLGEEGLERLAKVNHANAVQLADRLSAIPVGRGHQPRISSTNSSMRTPRPAAELIEALAAARGDRRIAGLAASAGAGLDDLHRRRQHGDEYRRRPRSLCAGACRLPAMSPQERAPSHERPRSSDPP